MYLFKYFTFLGDHHGGSTVLKNTVIFSATDFSEIIYRLTTRQLVVNIGHTNHVKINNQSRLNFSSAKTSKLEEVKSLLQI